MPLKSEEIRQVGKKKKKKKNVEKRRKNIVSCKHTSL